MTITDERTRQVKFDVEATVLAAICLFLWVSLLSYDRQIPLAPS